MTYENKVTSDILSFSKNIFDDVITDQSATWQQFVKGISSYLRNFTKVLTLFFHGREKKLLSCMTFKLPDLTFTSGPNRNF